MEYETTMESSSADNETLEDSDVLESSGDFSSDGLDTQPAMITGDVYDGTISSTYLEYFNGIVCGLSPDMEYLIYRPDRYSYTLYYSEEMTEDAGRFYSDTGSYITVTTNNGTSVSRGTDSLDIFVGTTMVYSNLPGYSRSLKGGTGIESTAILFVLCLMVCYNILHDIFDYAMSLWHR